jgi:predicted PurR-regulated permease PerM
MADRPERIEISHRTIIFTVFFLLGLWFLFQIRQIILALFISIILMSALNPIVSRMERFKLPRWLSILSLYLLILGGVGLMIAIVIPAVISQTELFVSKIVPLVKNIGLTGLDIDQSLITSQISQLGSVPANLLKVIVGVLSNIVGIFAILVITFYLLLERKNLNKYLLVLFGEGEEKKAENFVDNIEKRLGSWVRGEFILMVTIGIMTYVGLRILGIDVALPLAILAGLMEIVPNIGPIISAIPAVLASLAISPLMTVAVLALYFLIHQSENGLVTPKVMQKTIGVNPLVTILSLAIGAKIGGIAGAVLAVPVVLVIQVIASELFSSKRFQNL